MEIDGKEDEWDWESKENEVKKKILKKGRWDGSRATVGSICSLTIESVEGSWDSSIEVGEKVQFVIGDGARGLERLLERCVRTMDRGECARVKLGGVSCILSLEDFENPETPEHEYNEEQTLKNVALYKDRGNEYFREGKYEEAYCRFGHAARLLIFAGKSKDQILPVYLTVCNNIALCHLRLKRPELAVEVCNKVLEQDGSNVKALFRRALAYRQVRDFEKALVDLHKVLDLDPNNPKAHQMLPDLKADITDMNKRYTSMVQKMFNYA